MTKIRADESWWMPTESSSPEKLHTVSNMFKYYFMNFQPGLAPLSLQFPSNPFGFVNLFSIPLSLRSDGDGLILHRGVLVDNRTRSRFILQNRLLNVVRKGT